ncbi:MAG: hypothetical protein IKU62_05310 [Ruminiclostridium sp.]|nr:hypothetical protein [Ruminiclostridium sp.]
MKKLSLTFATILTCLSLVPLSGCMRSIYEGKAVGVWEGDGSLNLSGITAPFEHATQLEFHSDGTVEATVDGQEFSFRYSMTDDTLTINGEEESWGLLYEIKGDTLTLGSSDHAAAFTKAD